MNLAKIRKYILILLLVFIALSGAASWYFSSLVLYPTMICNPEHHVFCKTPEELNLVYEEVIVETPDHLNLQSWFIPATNSKLGIVVVHGHGGTRNEGLRFAKSLHQAGFNLLLLNLRRNSGGMATMGALERNDAKAGVDFFLNQKKMNAVGIFGFSMGSATSILAMADDTRIRAGLFSSGYTSALGVMEESAQRDFGLPKFPLLYLVPKVINFRAGIKIEEARPIDAIEKIGNRPIAIMHCAKDDYVDSNHALKLKEKSVNLKDFWLPDCDRHERIWNAFPEEAEKRASGFFKENLK